MQGLMAALSRETFSVSVLSIGENGDAIAEAIRTSADEYVVLPPRVQQARQIVASQKLDVLIYPDVSRDACATSLAFHRLAPVQCATWGHPATTGIPNIDYFLSSELLEADEADSHYTEHLLRLTGLPAYYHRPRLPKQRRERGHYGIPEDCHLYLCPQSPAKFHPEFDLVLGEILDRDPLGRIVLVEAAEPSCTERLCARLRGRFRATGDRLHVVARQSHDDFLNLLALCDVLLDPVHFGGRNTTYEALALGIPIVTLPTAFMRGRMTAACYRKMGLADCIAASDSDYVDRAVRLGTDRAHRAALVSRILAANDVLYEDRQALHEIEAFLQAAVSRARRNETPTLPDASPLEAEKHPEPPRLPSHRLHTDDATARGEAKCEDLPLPPLSALLRSFTCPACGHHVATPFYDGGDQPLATLAWPRTAHEARAMKRLPLAFVRCVDCGHVYNSRFNYGEVPYSDKPNLMFNKGAVWTKHLARIRDLILKELPQRPVVAEIGCGEGHLLRSLAERRLAGRYVGFDPSGAINTGSGMIEGRRELFDPARHLAELRPDLIISRHVLEHLMNPLGFVQEISFAASWENIETRLFIEVPCIDQALRTGRTVDFFYEHNSNFTKTSLERLLARCASDVEIVSRSYNDEVVYGLAHFRRRHDQVEFAVEAARFCSRAIEHRQSIQVNLDDLARSGKRVAVWGGTGKAAAFINQNGIDSKRFPLVVDSDLDKAGSYVPGAGQEILYRDFLLQFPVDIILIATQWRAADIVDEIERCGIVCEKIMLEHQGRLVDYFSDEHPYRRVRRMPQSDD